MLRGETQLKATSRVAYSNSDNVFFPMIRSVDEFLYSSAMSLKSMNSG